MLYLLLVYAVHICSVLHIMNLLHIHTTHLFQEEFSKRAAILSVRHVGTDNANRYTFNIDETTIQL